MPALSDYDRAKRIAASCECPDCLGEGVRLTVKRHRGRDTAYCLRCGRSSGFIRRETPYTAWRHDPDSVPLEVANVFERKYGRPQVRMEVPSSD